ncbi:MAG: DMT family transporter [Bacteroidales bacterium]|nr:DMT family transporter [Bacteroidales bacterium]MCF8344492.1 DMT family transporter [Bacteroidales bacterium]MCF8350995.1 DMT family transporter [Bacteroidales bacterium]MCF8376119.1 DMT family transporter [Bacteroidales bacterium]MCF8401432.1 DMT family transporter [Bacteroidales bacterium]
MDKNKIIKSDLILFTTALIWGFAFVAQKEGMEHIGPFTFNAIRFLMGTLTLLPLLYLRRKKAADKKYQKSNLSLLQAGTIAGAALFLGAAFQQTGIKYTTAGNAGFITSLYVIFTPVLGVFAGIIPKLRVWLGAVVATAGLYLLTVQEGLIISEGDLLVLICAIFYAVHVHVIGWLSPKFSSYRLAILQFLVAGVLSGIVAGFSEPLLWNPIRASLPFLLYVGVLSTGVAFTLQIVGQKIARPSHAAIILSFEAVFAAIGGWLLLGESFTTANIIGCFLMLIGILIAQIKLFRSL